MGTTTLKSKKHLGILRFNTLQEAREWALKTPYDRDEMTPFKCVHLLIAQEIGDNDLVTNIVSDLTLESTAVNAVAFLVTKMYGNYGLDELRFIYDTVTPHDCIITLLKAERKMWEKEMTWNFVSNSILKDSEFQYNTGLFVNQFLKYRLKGAYCKWFYGLVQNYYPDLSESRLGEYIRIRKHSNYETTLQTHTNQAIVDACEKNGYKTTWYKVDRIRQAFGYKSEPDTCLPLREQHTWKKEHPNELRYIKYTNADLIDSTEMMTLLSEIQRKMNLPAGDILVLKNWINRARYEGIGSNDGIKLTNSLRKRYFVEGKRNGDCDILKRFRFDIRSKKELFTPCLTLDVITHICTRNSKIKVA